LLTCEGRYYYDEGILDIISVVMDPLSKRAKTEEDDVEESMAWEEEENEGKDGSEENRSEGDNRNKEGKMQRNTERFKYIVCTRYRHRGTKTYPPRNDCASAAANNMMQLLGAVNNVSLRLFGQSEGDEILPLEQNLQLPDVIHIMTLACRARFLPSAKKRIDAFVLAEPFFEDGEEKVAKGEPVYRMFNGNPEEWETFNEINPEFFVLRAKVVENHKIDGQIIYMTEGVPHFIAAAKINGDFYLMGGEENSRIFKVEANNAQRIFFSVEGRELMEAKLSIAFEKERLRVQFNRDEHDRSCMMYTVPKVFLKGPKNWLGHEVNELEEFCGVKIVERPEVPSGHKYSVQILELVDENGRQHRDIETLVIK